jgi:catechol 2,3-dioxygenase-like lactoylglutathione lyase family enzyme
MLTALDHAVIAVRNLDGAAETYARLLGRPPSWRGEHAQLGTANVLFRLDNMYLELLSPRAEGPLAALVAAHLVRYGEGLFALVFGAADADACAAALRARGLSVTPPVAGEGRDLHTGARRTWRTVHLSTADTRGIVLFIIQHDAASDPLPLTPPTAEPSSAIFALDHAVIFTSDADAARRFYGERLSLRLALDRTFPERRVRLLFFRVGGVTVELAAPLIEGAVPENDDRFYGLSYRVRDVAASRARLDASGFEVSEVRPGMKPGTRVCTVRRETHGVATLLVGPDGG